MYPTLSFALEDMFGIHLPLPIQMFGFWVAIAFFLAAWVIKTELQRKENEGLLRATTRKVTVGLAPQFQPVAQSFAIGFFLGFKLLDAVLNYTAFSTNPQEFILSLRGNIWGGLAAAAFSAYLNYRDQKKLQLPKPKIEEQVTHPYELTGTLIVMAAIAGLIGAKIFHNLENWDELMADPIGSLLSFSGLTFYGGLIVAGIVIWVYSQKEGIPTAHMLDIAALPLALAYGVGRIGCQTSGDGDWGIPVTWTKIPSFLPEWFWQYNYPHNVINAGIPIEGYVGRYSHVLPQMVYPTPLWEAIAGIVVFIILWSIRKKLPVAGMLSGIYLVLMGIERFLVEKIRVNTTYHIGDYHITQAEIISTVSVLAGLFIIYYFNKHKNRFAYSKMRETAQSPKVA
ncbi:MAG: hypothetical protein RIS47_707 [Bacteroidota bacterium]